MIEINNLKKYYGNFTLNIPYLQLDNSKIYALLGKNGAGKTTFLNCITGQRDYTGEIFIDGQLYKKNREQILQRLGYTGEHLNFHREFTVSQFLNFFRSFYFAWDEIEENLLIKKFHLNNYLHNKLGSLSRGTSLKVSLVACLSCHHRHIILDEPTSGLDIETRDDVYSVIKAHKDKNSLILFSTHLTEDVDELADHILCFKDGELVFNQDRVELVKKSYDSSIRELLKKTLA